MHRIAFIIKLILKSGVTSIQIAKWIIMILHISYTSTEYVGAFAMDEIWYFVWIIVYDHFENLFLLTHANLAEFWLHIWSARLR